MQSVLLGNPWREDVLGVSVKFDYAICSRCTKPVKVRIYNWKRTNIAWRCRPCFVKPDLNKRTDKRLYTIYTLILRRVDNHHSKKSEHDSKYYDGISLCESWLNSYNAFEDWALKNGYSDDLTIDRIDNTGDYSPDNCRWVTHATQMQNQRISSKNTSGYKGISFDISRNKWKASLQTNGKVKQKRCNTLEEAVNLRNSWITSDKTSAHQIQIYTK